MWVTGLTILGSAIGGAAVGCGITLLVGMALLEIPFSLPFAVILGSCLLLLGVLVLYRLARDQSRSSLTAKSATLTAACTRVGEYAMLILVAILSLAGGVFSMWLYFQSRLLPVPVRLTMYCVLGMALTTLLSQNLLGLIEDCVSWCLPNTTITKGALKLQVKATDVAPRYKMFPLPSQQFVLYFASLATGLYYGYMFGQIAGRELDKADPRARYNPWPAVEAYLEYSVPVAASVGFLSVLVASLIPVLLEAAAHNSGGGAPAPAAAGFKVVVSEGVSPAASSYPGPTPTGGAKGVAQVPVSRKAV